MAQKSEMMAGGIGWGRDRVENCGRGRATLEQERTVRLVIGTEGNMAGSQWRGASAGRRGLDRAAASRAQGRRLSGWWPRRQRASSEERKEHGSARDRPCRLWRD